MQRQVRARGLPLSYVRLRLARSGMGWDHAVGVDANTGIAAWDVAAPEMAG